jgi:hypothetical protein
MPDPPHAGGRLQRCPAGGYASHAYAAALVDLGRPRLLPRSGTTLVDRPIPGCSWLDACGPYPLLVVSSWAELGDDLAELAANSRDTTDVPVSVVAVVSPFPEVGADERRRAFPDVVRRYKEHHVVDLSSTGAVSRHHARNVRRALAAVEVELVEDSAQYLDEWCALYGHLRRRHSITGLAAFSRESFERQLAVPGLTAFRAVASSDTVGMTLWIETDGVAYYHLGAYSDAGYELGASFALFATAIDHFRTRLGWLDLGAGPDADVADGGLARFKGGWATGTRPAFLCGRVLDPHRYERLVSRSPAAAASSFFPAYRTPG